ncbi:unnamed protein product [Camellia sinensis]
MNSNLLSNLSKLRHLDLSYNNFDEDAFRILGALPSLKFLSLVSNSMEGPLSNQGNLLNGTLPMEEVWRFLINFADVLGLWPFMLDEFVQAFHDYDRRLLGEIHVALLRSIIKDIEDVARTPSSTGLGVNQNAAANPGGGHPQIVEGAYAWGFDIRNWVKPTKARSSIGVTVAYGVTNSLRKANEIISELHSIVTMKAAKGKGAAIRVPKEALKPVDDRKVGKRKVATKANKGGKSQAKKGKLAKKDPNKPKRPPSAFFVFLSSERPS